jgi:GPI inositol-deacylase
MCVMIGYFVSFDDSLLLVIRDSLPLLLLLVSIASVWLAAIQRPEVSPFIVLNGRALEALDRIRGTQIDSPRRNDMLLGLREPFLWFLVPLFVLVCVGVTIVVSKIAFIATIAITALWNKIPSFPWLGAMQWLDRSAPWLAGVFRWIGSWWTTDSRYVIPNLKLMGSVLYTPGNVAASSRTKRRIFVTLVLLFIVATVVPFQFAYVVACVVQFSSCVKALNRTRDVCSW